MPHLIIAVGRVFGKLKVIDELPRTRNKHGKVTRRVRCVCECGKIIECQLAEIRDKRHEHSCGCGRKKHGHAGDFARSKAYIAWDHMVQRCTNPNCKAWKWYGERGITVCERWFSFENFIADMGPRPEGMTLERKDSNGNYEPANCCWDTTGVQARSKRTNRNFTINGVTGCMTDLAKHFGVGVKTVQGRIDISKWDPVRAFTEPVAKRIWKSKPGRPVKESSEPT